MNTQITEDYISFETAKLLKEKGFNELCRLYYDKYHGYIPIFVKGSKLTEYGYDDEVRNDQNSISDFVATAPSLYIVMKWLREVHKKNINIIYDLQKFQKTDGSIEDVDVYEVDIITKNGTFYIGNYNHYESAAEAAIKYCLTNLI